MRALYYLGVPLAWAPGGYTAQVLATAAALGRLGVEVAWLHHEAGELRGDLVHYWSRPPNDQHLDLARAHGCRIVHTALVGAGSARGALARRTRRLLRPPLRRVLGPGLYGELGLSVFEAANAVIVPGEATRRYVCEVYGAPPDRVHVIPNGVDAAFASAHRPAARTGRLVMVGSVQPNKQQVPVAAAARAAKVPLTLVGDPFPLARDYGERLRGMVDGELVQWRPHVSDRAEVARIIGEATGLVMASDVEEFGLAALEALALGTPVMVADNPALRAVYGDAIRYSPSPRSPAYGAALAAFHRDCLAGLRQPYRVWTWDEVAGRVADVYRDVCRSG